MNDALIAGLLVLSLFFILGSGVWIGLTLSGVAWIGMQLFTARPAGDAMAMTIWGASSSWTLTALPLFILMGEILFRTRLSEDMFRGLAPLLGRIPGRLLHTNVIGSLAGAGTLGLLIPPSIIMIVYGVTAEVSIAKLFIAGVIPGIILAGLFSGYIVVWSLLNRKLIPVEVDAMTFVQKFREFWRLGPVVLLIIAVLGSIYLGIATATEAAAVGVLGALILSAVQGSLSWKSFSDALMGATRLYCMIAFILAGAAFLTLSMGYIGLPRHLAEWIGTLGLSKFELILVIMVFYIVLGCFLDGISMIVLTMGMILPTIVGAGIDLIWFGIFLVLVVEMAQITPPVGFNLFVLQGMTKKPLSYIARVAMPMFFLMILTVLIFYQYPQIITWLPSKM
jgi:C4-dicarboxylate transporter DctM subunit